MKKALSLVLVLIMALSLAACGGVSETETTSEISTQPETLVVPNVVGMDKDEAVKLLEGMGFEVEVGFHHPATYTEGEERPKEVIVEQNPLSGIVLTKEGKIKIYYTSTDPTFVFVDNQDGTVRGVQCVYVYEADKTVVLPREYNGKKVSAYSFGEASSSTLENRTLKIPNGVEVQGEVPDNITIETY